MAKRERTEAQRRADARYKDSHCDRIAIMIEKGQRDKWKQIAEERGTTLKGLIITGVKLVEKQYKPGSNLPYPDFEGEPFVTGENNG